MVNIWYYYTVFKFIRQLHLTLSTVR